MLPPTDKKRILNRLIESHVLSYLFPGMPIPGVYDCACPPKYDDEIRFRTTSVKDIAYSRKPIEYAAKEKAKSKSHKSFGFLGKLFSEDEEEKSVNKISTSEIQAREEERIEREEKRVEIASKSDEKKLEGILAAIEDIQKEFGVTIDELETILSYKVQYSRLRVDRSCRIFLSDYDDVEIKLGPLAKTVFLLFLKHPEGIEYKDIADHRDEIESIYGRITRCGELAVIRKTIDSLCNTVECNSLNENVSRIKRAFINATDKRIANNYYIDGPAGGIHRIALDRSLVDWNW